MEKFTKLSWIINSTCNLKCVHCYPDSGTETKEAFSDDDFETLYDNLKGICFKRVFISGGEPVLDKNINKYINIAKNISDEVFLCSNGTVLSDGILTNLKNSGVKGIVLSLQAINPQTSLSIYGNAQVFDLVLKAIDKVRDYGFIFSVEITMMRKNLNFIEDIVQLLINKGVKTISFKRLLPVGRGENEENIITKEENYDMLNKIADWQVLYKDISFNVHDPLYATVLYDRFCEFQGNPKIMSWIKGFSCRAGTKWIGIGPQGDVSPCPILLYKNIVIGNVMHNNLKDILENSSLIKMLQEVESNSETSCKYNSICLGCRATAISKTQDFFAVDPMCMEKDAICPICLKKGKFNESDQRG